jgi:hypothetical protein
VKREIGFFDKLRIFAHWMKQHKNCGLITTCSFCDSTSVIRFDSKDKIHSNGDRSYAAMYRCLDCNAIAMADEAWTRGR